MQQLNKRWYHKLIDFLYPENCRKKLEDALFENRKAALTLLRLVNTHKTDVVAALKNDRRAEIRT